MTDPAPAVACQMRIPIRCNAFGRVLLTSIGAPPALDRLDIDEESVRVRLSYAFRTTIPRRLVESVRRDDRRSVSLGAHGWRGRWLVNGAWSPIVVIRLRTPVRAWVVGFPVRLRELLVSVDDPDAVIELLAPASV